MHTVQAAVEMVLRETPIGTPMETPISKAHGRTLANDVFATASSPPFDKSAVDGFAFRCLESDAAPRVLRVIETLAAGAASQFDVADDETIRIMTGAPIPPSCNAVAMLEHVDWLGGTSSEGHSIRVSRQHVPGQNIIPKGASFQAGQMILERHRTLSPVDIGLLAEVGLPTVRVFPPPRVSVCVTGNEIVPCDAEPGGSQIRNSNGPMLRALLELDHAECRDLGIVRDQADALRDQFERGLSSDVLLITGGVSAGLFDLAPSTLESLGVRKVFHHVNLKPGKPLWFGVKDFGSRRCLVFGLPGNPVSVLVCYRLFVLPAIEKLANRQTSVRPIETFPLSQEFQQRGDRVTYWPSRLIEGAGDVRLLEPLPWKGSSDLKTLSEATRLAIFPSGAHTYETGEKVETIRLWDQAR